VTVTARKVLRDLEFAFELLEVEEIEEKFRLLWVSAISLVRSVGHVLNKVDRKRSPKLEQEISKKYSSWKNNPEENKIFFEFIENERNSLLKEYEFGFLSSPIGIVVTSGNESFNIGENLFLPMSEGIYTGEDCRDVLGDAIAWWKQQIHEIESAIT
jgi:hypothetical protein